MRNLLESKVHNPKRPPVNEEDFTFSFSRWVAKNIEQSTWARNGRSISILIPLQLSAAKGAANTDDPTFCRLASEVAFTEYARSSELGRRGEYSDWIDPIYEIRQTVNRLARKGSHLYMA